MTFEEKFEEFLENFALEEDMKVYREVTAISEIEEKRSKTEKAIDAVIDKEAFFELDSKANKYITEMMIQAFWQGFDDAKDNVNLWTEVDKVKEDMQNTISKIKENTFEASEEYNECFDRIAEKHQDNSLMINLLGWHADLVHQEAHENCFIGYMLGARMLVTLSFLIKKKGRPSNQEENALSYS